jgi:hypothetical protein
MASLREVAQKVLAWIKRIPIDDDDEGCIPGNPYCGPQHPVNHNGVGLGARGPKNDWGASGGVGY